MLFVPGSVPKTVAEVLPDAAATGADAVIIDIEEPARPSPVTESTREQMRSVVRAFLDEVDQRASGPQWWARVQAVDSHQTLIDLRAVVGPSLAGVVIPKSFGALDIVRLDALLSGVETMLGCDVGTTRILPLLETPSAIRNAYELAMASGRVAYMGGMAGRSGDQARSVGYTWTAEGSESLFVRSKAVVDARAAGIRYPIGGMWCGDQTDLDGLRDFSEETRGLGYFGMLVARPEHVATVNEVFSPNDADVQTWTELDEIGRDAEAAGSEVMTRIDAVTGEKKVITEKDVSMARLKLAWARGIRPV